MKRRGALQMLVSGAAMLAGATLPAGMARLLTPAAQAAPRRRLRPPGARRPDAEFVAACIGCGLCGEVCPPRCIRFHRRDGASAANTPFIVPEQKACILCSRCMSACPTDALTETPRRKIDMGIAQIDRAACYPWVDKGVCGACVSICPLGKHGIGFKMWNQYRPVVRTGCVGCGLCVEVCPHPSLPIRIVEREQGAVTRHRI